MGLKQLTQKQSAAVLAGTGIVTAIAGLTTLALVLIGLPPSAGTTSVAVAPHSPGITSASWSQTPATTALTGALDNPPAGWQKQGNLQRLVTAPLPYSCPQPGLAPTASLARSFTSSGARFQVMVLAYTAGLGAEAMERQVANAAVCSGPDAGLYLVGLDGPGSEAQQATVTRGQASTSVVSFRRGDVITYVTGTPGEPLQRLAQTFDDGLRARLQGVCLNQESTTADASRSPWGSGYKPFTATIKATIADVPLPRAAQASPTPAPSPATSTPSAPAPARVPIPSPDLVERTATPMDRPPFPVSPEMPAPVAQPEAPQAPAARAATEASLQVPAADTDGPGCGWSFTGMLPLVFDDVAATTKRTGQLATARARLDAGAKAWQASVLAYWRDYALYQKEAGTYNAYVEQVDAVNKSWSAMAATWETYNQAVQDRALKSAEHDAFIARQDAARKEYDAKHSACEAPAPVPTPSPSPSPSVSPAPSASASPSPTASPGPKTGCPAERPKILDEAPPQVPPAPAKPTIP